VSPSKRDGDTTVFVTADHASQILEAGSVTPGITVNLLTADDAPMTINYATAAKGSSMQHTGTQLRIAGYGPGAANIVGLTDQTDLNTTIRRILGLRSGPAASQPILEGCRENARVTSGQLLRGQCAGSGRRSRRR